MQRIRNSCAVKSAVGDEQRQIHEVLHPAVLRASGKRVGVDLPGELLFP